MKIKSHYFVALLIIAIVVLIPWNSLTLFNTKGEPREAIVAVSMLNQGDWVLPLSHGSDLPYKPPMLAWCIAALSLMLNGGVVTEFLSRLPSALAGVALVMLTFSYFKRHTDERTAAMTSAILLTSVEVMRAAVVCRVDMLLTMAIVGAIYMLADIDGTTAPRRKLWQQAAALVFMTIATLTKGPVGALLPCLVVGLYRLMKGDNFVRTVIRLAILAILTMIIPAVWYYAAYRRAGDEFLRLALEENVGRLTGKMSYDSHLNPWWYNIVTILAGMVPYTLLALMSVVAVKWRNIKLIGWRRLSDESLLSIVAAGAVFIFYCIPASKRSVYLLPCYPFMAYGITLIIKRLETTGSKILPVYRRIINALILIVLAAVIVAKTGVLSSLHGKVGEYDAMLHDANPWALVFVVMAMAGAAIIIRRDKSEAARIIAPIIALYISYFSMIQPALLNPRSNEADARRIEAYVPNGQPIYSYIDDELMRFYTLNYYLGDRMRQLTECTSDEGWVIAADNELWQAEFPQYSVTPTPISFKSCDNKQQVRLWRVESGGQ